MKDSELDPAYVERRDQLKELVATIMHPKIVQGKTLTGKEFASFLEQVFLNLHAVAFFFSVPSFSLFPITIMFPLYTA